MAGEVDDASGVEDQTDAAVAKDGSTGHAFDATEAGAECLRDDLALPKKFVDKEPAMLATVVDDDHEALGWVLHCVVDFEQAMQAEDRDERPTTGCWSSPR